MLNPLLFFIGKENLFGRSNLHFVYIYLNVRYGIILFNFKNCVKKNRKPSKFKRF